MVQVKKNNLLRCTALGLLLMAGSAQAKDIEYNTARMQAMDKITGKVSEIDVPVNGEAIFGSFSVVVRSCHARPPEETPENFAFVDVVDNHNTDKEINIFKGWMISSSPALNAVEHPIYDVWLLKCYNSDNKGRKLLSAETLKERDGMARAVIKTAVTDKAEANPLINKEPAVPVVEPISAEVQTSVKPSPEPLKNSETVQDTIVFDSDANDYTAEDGAPKSLLNIGAPVGAKQEDVVEKVVNELAASENQTDANSQEPVMQTEEIQQEDDHPVEGALSENDVLLTPEAESLSKEEVLSENVGEADSSDVETIGTPPLETQEDLAAEEQLIKFDGEEVEEDGFELNADALAN